MEKNVYLIKWYGPFSSPEKVEKWEKKYEHCNLYLLHGMEKYAKTKDKFYCGKTIRKVFERFQDKGHHINDIKDRISEIYIGKIANIDSIKDSDILLVEKVITAYLAQRLGQDSLLNKINFRFPNINVYIINEWWKPHFDEVWQKQSSNSVSKFIPNLMCYHYFSDDDIEVFGAMKFKKLV